MEKEINQLISEINNEFNSRVDFLKNSDGFNTLTQEKINHLEIRKYNLVSSGIEIINNFLHSTDILINYKKRVIELKEEINKLF